MTPADYIGIYGAVLSTISALYYLFANIYKKPKYQIVSRAPNGVSVLLYNKMNKPLQIMVLEIDVKDNDGYLMYGRINITNKHPTVIEHKEGIIVKWHGVIEIVPNGYEHLTLHWEEGSYRYIRKPKWYEKKDIYLRTTTVDGKKYKI